MKRLFLIIIGLLLIRSAYSQQENHAQLMRIETTTDLIIYYPQYSNIDLVCGQMPQKSESDVLFCCEAAFTGELLKEFKHSNIAGHHVSGGMFYRGYKCKPNTGGFVFYNNHNHSLNQFHKSIILYYFHTNNNMLLFHNFHKIKNLLLIHLHNLDT